MSKPLNLISAPSNFDTRKANSCLSAFLFCGWWECYYLTNTVSANSLPIDELCVIVCRLLCWNKCLFLMLVSSVFFEYCALVVPTAYWHCHSEYRHIIFCFHSVYCLILTLVSTKKIQMFLEIIDNQFVASFF